MSAIRIEAFPSPKGFLTIAIFSLTALFSISSHRAENIISSSTPAITMPPHSAASGRSVVSLARISGIFREAASSWMPPLSVSTKWQEASSL